MLNGWHTKRRLPLARAAFAQAPRNAHVLDTLGIIYMLKGQHIKAIDFCTRAVQRAPDSAVMRFHLGKAYYLGGQRDRGRQELEKALDLDANFEDADEARRLLRAIQGTEGSAQ